MLGTLIMLEFEVFKQKLLLCTVGWVITFVGIMEDIESLYLALDYRNKRKQNQNDDKS